MTRQILGLLPLASTDVGTYQIFHRWHIPFPDPGPSPASAPGDLEVVGRSPWHAELLEYLPACRCLPDLAADRLTMADPLG